MKAESDKQLKTMKAEFENLKQQSNIAPGELAQKIESDEIKRLQNFNSHLEEQLDQLQTEHHSALRSNDQFLENQRKLEKVLRENKNMVSQLQQENIVVGGLQQKLMAENNRLVAEINNLSSQQQSEEINKQMENLGGIFAKEKETMTKMTDDCFDWMLTVGFLSVYHHWLDHQQNELH